jgi:formate hydrogenlyase subunit 3/multisubunit Na+/H+ antiporter MnhD subunit
MGKYVLLASLFALLALAVWWMVAAWNTAGDTAEMSGQFYAPMILGIVFSLAVGIGLMSLVFYSARKGYDRPAERERR